MHVSVCWIRYKLFPPYSLIFHFKSFVKCTSPFYNWSPTQKKTKKKTKKKQKKNRKKKENPTSRTEEVLVSSSVYFLRIFTLFLNIFLSLVCSAGMFSVAHTLTMLLQEASLLLLLPQKLRLIIQRQNWSQELTCWGPLMRYFLIHMTDTSQSMNQLWTIALYPWYVHIESFFTCPSSSAHVCLCSVYWINSFRVP